MMNFTNLRRKRGSAMMQVLVLGGIIAGIVALLLRFATTRTINIIKTERVISANAYAEGCMAEYTASAMLRELHGRPPAAGAGGDFIMDGSAADNLNCSVILADDAAPTLKPMHLQSMPGDAYEYSGQTYTLPPTLTRVEITIDKTDLLK